MAVRYGTLVWYGTPQFLLRSTVRFFRNGMSTLRWYGTPFLQWYGYGMLVRCLNLPTKRFMCNVRPSMKIPANVPGMHVV